MRKLFLLVFFFAVGSIAAQTVSGVVREKATGLPLPFANVFVNNTTQGIATDSEGKFSLSGNFPSQIELVASFMGYVTEVKSVSFEGQNQAEVIFELSFNESNLSEIELKATRDKSWERDLKKFEGVFLAVSDDPYRTKIEILNPWVIDFEKVKVKKGLNYLQASAQEPLIINNHALGYEIEYYLQDFRMMRSGSSFYGQVFYKPLNQSDSEKNLSWANARKANYLGSLVHLNQSILLNSPDSNYFAMFEVASGGLDRRITDNFIEELNKTILPVKNTSILRRPIGDGNYRIFLPKRMEIHHLDKKWSNNYYKNIYHPISWIKAPDGFYDIDRKGNLINPTQLVVFGYFGRKGVARTLPHDFTLGADFVAVEPQEEMSVFKSELKVNRLREKVWIAMNKPYYYPGETAWIGGRMLYKDAFLADSLSRLIHVDILQENSEVIQSADFEIQKGKISGGMVLPKDMIPGDYMIRAYTHWNHNFPEDDQFVFPLIIMEQGFRPEFETDESKFPKGTIDVSSDITLTDSLNYQVMDLKLEFLDEFENPIEAEFIFSISDPVQVIQMNQEIRLDQAIESFAEDLPDTLESSFNYPVEYGISIQGKFITDNKRQPLITPITVVQGDLEDFGQVLPDSLGNFWITGLTFQDTARIAIAAVNKALKPFGSVEVFEIEKPEFNFKFYTLNYQKTPIPSDEYFLDVSGDFILMEEFVKEETRERETLAERNYGYGMPDREVNEKELATMTPEAINQRLNIRGGRIGNYNFGQKTGPPLLIVDGAQVPFEVLERYFPTELKSIKVYTFNSTIFGMAGYAGVIMVETIKGSRTKPEEQTKFNSEGFQFFSVPGFTAFPEFPKNPPADQYLRKKPTIYWEPEAKTSNGVFQVAVKVPYGINRFRIQVEGTTFDGEVIYKVIHIEK
ncbi:carboxypeptidase-like regulatory domain-containing protein [Algoriphagus persicinus]|uniref:carboxypeptidase-like regulatory domain-containing protein n=1 Tax=Algoriphagus persicinus TaxID=3108754 RepID=UPI002B364DFF|nr:carboxypeptidase-like regulatory domain-containing protein [Algoriphagus sp. E1-3-M2]MEB2786298.1 carboxypeptidase-like regulatory domain-containing protein [Algoriphagus sp. E1-3-M2]